MATQLAETGDEAPIVLDTDDGEPAPRDADAEARLRGWRPESEWPDDKPKPAKFKTAEEFLALEDEAAPLLRKKVERQGHELSELRRLVKRLTKAEQSAYENAMADLKAKAEAAVESGDLAAFRRVDTRIEELRKEAVAADETHGEDPQEAYDAFREANAWYDRANLASASEIEVEARLFADRLADKYVAKGLQQEVTPTEFFARITRETEERFPLLKVKRTREKPASPVGGVTNGGQPRNAKTGANLPPEAKEHARRYMRMGIYRDCKTEAEAFDRFAKDYTWPTS